MLKLVLTAIQVILCLIIIISGYKSKDYLNIIIGGGVFNHNFGDLIFNNLLSIAFNGYGVNQINDVEAH